MADIKRESEQGGAPGGTTRRTVLLGAGSVGAVAVLAACGSNSGTGGTGATAGSTASKDLGKSSAIPVGSGVIFADQNVVVTQPTGGVFKAFNATCTHMGCQVSDVTNGSIHCMCHGSLYSIVDGSVKQGPATRPLGAETVTVANGEITLA